MKLRTPLVTLVLGLLLAGGLYVADRGASRDRSSVATAAQLPAAAPTQTPAGGGSPAPSAAATASAGAKASSPAATGTAVSTSVGSGSKAATRAIAKATYAGHVKGHGPAFAIAVRNGVAISYVCDGRSLESWLRGYGANGRLELTGKGGSRISATYGGGHAVGTLVADGKAWKFDIRLVKKPSGLWRAQARVRNRLVDAGWVVLPDGSQVGVFTEDGGAPQEGPHIDPISGTSSIDGASVRAVGVDPDSGSGF
jgi:hypothetical protein